MGTVLDCSSSNQAIASMSELLGISSDDLRRNAKHLNIARADLPQPSAIRWFHATRTVDGVTFDDGLLPANAALPKLWQSLGSIASKWTTAADWESYRDDFERSDRRFPQQFRRKRDAPGWEGPFAFLVRDAALNRHGCHKDFTRICEALEDVCLDYEELYGHPLREVYEAATKPCLVTFTLPAPVCDWRSAVKAALKYVRSSVVGVEPDLESNANFNGRGQAVPRSYIDIVEWPLQGPRYQYARHQ